MFDLQKNYRTAFGKELSDAQVQKYLRISRALEIDDNDAVWKMFVLGERSIDILDEAPARIEQKLRECTERFDRFSEAYGTRYRSVIADQQTQYRADLDNHLVATKAAADSIVTASANTAVERLASEVAKSVARVVKDVSGKQKAKWIGTMTAVVGVVLLGVGWAGFWLGEQAGRSVSRDERAADSWGNSLQGKTARTLASGGSLDHLAHCTGQGWKVTKGVCYPFAIDAGAEKGNVTGWRLSR